MVSMLIILCSCSAKAQDVIVNFVDHKGEKCHESVALFYNEACFDSSLGMWNVKSYYMDGQLRMKGQCLDKNFKKREGTFVFYHHSGNVQATGEFSDGKRYGIWRDYDRSGNLRAEVSMRNNIKEGPSIYYHANGSVFGEITYVNDKGEGESRWYYESGQLSEITTYKQGKVKNKINYDENGNIVKKVKDRDFKINNQEQNLVYPEELWLQGKEGIVLIFFIVRKDGSIDNSVYISSGEPLFDQEAIRIFNSIRTKPVRQHGQIVEYEGVFPVVFRLPPKN